MRTASARAPSSPIPVLSWAQHSRRFSSRQSAEPSAANPVTVSLALSLHPVRSNGRPSESRQQPQPAPTVAALTELFEAEGHAGGHGDHAAVGAAAVPEAQLGERRRENAPQLDQLQGL